MRAALLLALALALSSTAEARVVHWSVPARSAACSTCCEPSAYPFPARIAKMDLYFWLPSIRTWRKYIGWRMRTPGAWDNRQMSVTVPEWLPAWREARGARIAVYNDKGRWPNCPDPEVMW